MKRITASLTVLFISFFLFSCKSADKKTTVKKPEKVKDGPGQILWEDGSLKGKGNFKNFIKEGEWTLYYKGSGEKLALGNYLDDKQEGFWVFFHKNGAKSTEGTFEGNQKTGKWTGYHDNDAMEWTANYVLRDSEFGKIGVIEGTKTSYYKSGKVRLTEEYRNGLKKGKYQEFYENGKPKEISWFTDDKHNGKCNTYWENGNSKEQGLFLDDLRNGAWKIFYDNGQLRMSGDYVIGKMQVKSEVKSVSQMHGKWQFFSKEGLLQKEGEYRNNKEEDLWKFYTYPGSRKRVLMMELTLKGGMAGGFGKIYENGLLTGTGDMFGAVKGRYEKYVNDKPAGEEESMDVPPDNPNIGIVYKWTGKWLLPKRNGKWTEYFPGGKNKKFEAFYMMDKLNGKYNEYYKNGKRKASGEYMNGKKSGMWEAYNENGSKNEEESGRWMMGKKSKF